MSDPCKEMKARNRALEADNARFRELLRLDVNEIDRMRTRAEAEAVATERCEECDHPDSVHNQLHKRAARHDEEPDFAIRAVRIFRKALHELYGEERP